MAKNGYRSARPFRACAEQERGLSEREENGKRSGCPLALGYEKHIFVCTNSRTTGESCGAKGALQLRDELKALCKKDLSTSHRINAAGCLGYCEQGIVAVEYPSGKWWTELRATDAEKLALEL